MREEDGEGAVKEERTQCSLTTREREVDVDRYYVVVSHSQNAMSSPGDWFGRGEMDGYEMKTIEVQGKE